MIPSKCKLYSYSLCSRQGILLWELSSRIPTTMKHSHWRCKNISWFFFTLILYTLVSFFFFFLIFSWNLNYFQCIYGHSGGALFTTHAYAAVLHHQQNPEFYSEVRASLIKIKFFFFKTFADLGKWYGTVNVLHTMLINMELFVSFWLEIAFC